MKQVSLRAWEGTWLSAVFLSTRRIDRLWPDLVRAWNEEGLFDSGQAHVLNVSPERVSHRYLMETPNIPFLPEVAWQDGLGDLEAVLMGHVATRLYLPTGAPDVGEVMVDVILNHDDTVSVYVNVPCDEVCRGETTTIRQGRVDQFLAEAERFFDPELFDIGTVGEEVQLYGPAQLAGGVDLVTDWAFYGAALAGRLRAQATDVKFRAREWRDIPGGGLFVRWADWDALPEVPDVWKGAVQTAVAEQLL